MKKISNILLILATMFSFSACDFSIDLGGGDKADETKDEIKAADTSKKTEVTKDEETKVEEKSEEAVDESKDEEDTKKDEEIKKLENKVEDLEKKVEEEKKPEAYTGENYITLSNPSNNSDIYEEPIIFNGVVSPNTTKIVVTASNGVPGDMMYYKDVYTLNDFDYGDSTFVYRAKVEWSNLSFGTNNYEFTAYFDDGSKKSANITVFYSTSIAEIGKPVIYLYPEETSNIFVNVDPTGGVSVSEPALNDGWNVIASPEGKILNLADFKVYPYLFYEGYSYDFETPEEGFVIAKEEVDRFFDEKLSILGLNEKEIADFKEFWIPLLNEDSYYFIAFIPQEEFDSYAPLTVSPTPDSVIRVFFDYKGLEEPIEVTEQQLSTPT